MTHAAYYRRVHPKFRDGQLKTKCSSRSDDRCVVCFDVIANAWRPMFPLYKSGTDFRTIPEILAGGHQPVGQKLFRWRLQFEVFLHAIDRVQQLAVLVDQCLSVAAGQGYAGRGW